MRVHIFAARCDLETGRSLNIAPPGWQETFGPLRDAFNHEHGWSRPDDPARARADQPGHRAYIDAANLRAGLEVEADPREVIRDYLLQRVEHGVVHSRADVVEALEEAGLDVPRQGKDQAPPGVRQRTHRPRPSSAAVLLRGRSALAGDCRAADSAGCPRCRSVVATHRRRPDPRAA